MDYSNPETLMEQRRKLAEDDLNAQAKRAFLFSIISLVFGFVVFRTTFAILALRKAAQVEREANSFYMPVPKKVRITRILAILSLCVAAFFVAIGLASLSGIITSGIESGAYKTAVN